MFADAHVHLSDYFEKLTQEEKLSFRPDGDIVFCTSSNTKEAFEEQKKLCTENTYGGKAFFCFGIHPQEPVFSHADFLEELLEKKQITAIGECGFDLFDLKNKETAPAQKKVWAMQISAAEKYRLPIVIHCRKALDLIFADTKTLKKLPSVIFHGWGGGINEAKAFLKKGVNAYFCAGKGLLRGQRAQKELAADFDINRILTETDAPYMMLKGEKYSSPQDIKKVAAEIFHLRNIPPEQTSEYLLKLYTNFRKAFELN